MLNHHVKRAEKMGEEGTLADTETQKARKGKGRRKKGTRDGKEKA